MNRFFIVSAFAAALAISPQAQARESDPQVRQRLIQESMAAYPGNCPCPFNTDRAGRRCGARSAWNRAGGHAPLCYDSDIDKEMVDRNRR